MPGTGWKSWNWLDTVAIPALSAGMRVAWAVPVTNAVLGSGFVAPHLRVPVWLALALLLGASLAANSLSGNRRGRTLVALLGVLAVLGSVLWLLRPTSLADLWRYAVDWEQAVPALWVIVPVSAGLWLRGVSIDWLEAGPLRQGFAVGVAALASLALLSGSRYGQILGIADGALEPFVAFTVCGLLAFALNDISLTLRQSVRASGSRPQLGRYWMYVVVVSVVVVLLAAWLVALVLAPETVQMAAKALSPVLRVFKPVVDLVSAALAYVATAIAYVVFALLTPLINWLRGMLTNEPPEETILDRPSLADQLRDLEPGRQGGADIGLWVQGLLVVLAVVVLFVLFVLAFRRRHVTRPDGMVESREVDWSLGLMRAQLGRWLSRRRRRPGSRFLPLVEAEEGRARVREAYRQLLARAGERAPGQTPLDYMRALAASGPDLADPLAVLTEAYQIARYSGEPLSPEAVAAALEALARVEAILNARPAAVPEPNPAAGNGGSRA